MLGKYNQILLTGATGFVGRALAPALQEAGYGVRCAVRAGVFQGYQSVTIGNIDADTDWSEALSGAKIVIHLANQAHLMNASQEEAYAFYKTNVEGTASLVRQAITAGVGRFIYISSVKVHGDATDERPFTVDSPFQPEGSYAQSKLDAEQQIRSLCAGTAMEWVVLRPPLIYGPGVKGNLAQLGRYTRKSLPLPFASIENRRDLIGLANLVDLIKVCIEHPQAPSQVFLCADGCPISTADLVRLIARAQGIQPRLWSCPTSILTSLFALLGKKGLSQRLIGNLEVDMSHTRSCLGWEPPFSVAEQIEAMYSE